MNTEFEKVLSEYGQASKSFDGKRAVKARARVVALYEAERGHHAVTADRLMNAESSLARLQAECDRMREALADIEKYPATRQDERSAADLRRVARLALARTAPAQEETK